MSTVRACEKCGKEYRTKKAWQKHCSQLCRVRAHRALKLASVQTKDASMGDVVNHPAHYNAHGSGIECVQVTEHMNFCLGNAVKYIWRAGLKSPNAIEDLKKSRWYIDREIARLEKEAQS